KEIIMASTAMLEPVVVESSPSSDDELLYEIIDGQRVEIPPMSAYATLIAFQLTSYLNEFARVRNLGRAVTEILIHLPLPEDRNRRPDGIFVSYQRWPKGQPIPEDDNAWSVVPDLVIEVVSPTDLAEDLLAKVEEYFR